MSEPALLNRRVLVPESRELDLFCRMLEAEGATAIRCPMVAILDLEDPAPVAAWLDRLVASQHDDLILLTGEGLRRIMTVARNDGREAETVQAIGRLRTITRGPKPVRVLRELGLTPGLSATDPTTEGVIATLRAQAMEGRRVAVQLYPGNPNEALLSFLARVGATADPVLPYRYASDAEGGAVADAIRAMAAGEIDLIAFTSSPQVRRLVEVAQSMHLEAEVRAGLGRTRIAAVGPVVAEAVRSIGGVVAIEPETSFHLKPLVTAIKAALA